MTEQLTEKLNQALGDVIAAGLTMLAQTDREKAEQIAELMESDLVYLRALTEFPTGQIDIYMIYQQGGHDPQLIFSIRNGQVVH